MADAGSRNGSSIEAAIEIGAAPDRVWSVLVDFASYPEWNPLIRSIEGIAGTDELLRVSIRPPGGLGMRLRPRILKSIPDHELRWRGRLAIPGLLDGEHFFLIDPIGTQRVRFTQGERFSGILFRMFSERFLAVTQAGFRAANDALKRRCESYR